MDWGPKSFRVLDAWKQLNDFNDIIKSFLEQVPNKWHMFNVMKEKLKMLKKSLKL